MYMTPEAMRGVVERIAHSLRPGGFLFLGHAETLRGVSRDFHLRHTHDTFYYERRSRHDSSTAGLEGAGLGSAPVSETRDARLPLSVALGLEDASWVDTIARATQRVAEITQSPRRPPSARPAPSPAVTPLLSGAPSDRHDISNMMREERFEEALEKLGSRPATGEPDAETALLRAVLLTNVGRFEDAEAACNALLAADALHAGAHYLLALCREHSGDRAGAIDHDQTATYVDPTFAMPRLHLGLLERRAGRLAQAEAELRRALALLPGEEASRVLLFGGGFGREALAALCRSELKRCGGAP